MSRRLVFKCPNCGARPNQCGKGACAGGSIRRDDCMGFICECAKDGGRYHGEMHEDPCGVAVCYHCDWVGIFPVPLFDVKKFKGWAKAAWAAGWRPPPGWKP